MPEEPLPIFETSPQSLYARARVDAIDTLLRCRRDLNRLASLSQQLGDDQLLEVARYHQKCSTLLDVLEEV